MGEVCSRDKIDSILIEWHSFVIIFAYPFVRAPHIMHEIPAKPLIIMKPFNWNVRNNNFIILLFLSLQMFDVEFDNVS